MPTVPNSVYATLALEVHEQMFRSGGQSDAKSPALSSQAESLPEPDKIDNLIKEVGLASQINSEVDSDNVRELLDSHEQELTMDELLRNA
ncbi:hypothetical protein TNCV_5072281 [Trichonephila clavipes]|nr:hypothetical protein TNCV_5072281 [Trichonephila clavipes]